MGVVRSPALGSWDLSCTKHIGEGAEQVVRSPCPEMEAWLRRSPPGSGQCMERRAPGKGACPLELPQKTEVGFE